MLGSPQTEGFIHALNKSMDFKARVKEWHSAYSMVEIDIKDMKVLERYVKLALGEIVLHATRAAGYHSLGDPSHHPTSFLTRQARFWVAIR